MQLEKYYKILNETSKETREQFRSDWNELEQSRIANDITVMMCDLPIEPVSIKIDKSEENDKD